MLLLPQSALHIARSWQPGVRLLRDPIIQSEDHMSLEPFSELEKRSAQPTQTMGPGLVAGVNAVDGESLPLGSAVAEIQIPIGRPPSRPRRSRRGPAVDRVHVAVGPSHNPYR